jgi:hypothetical protein
VRLHRRQPRLGGHQDAREQQRGAAAAQPGQPKAVLLLVVFIVVIVVVAQVDGLPRLVHGGHHGRGGHLALDERQHRGGRLVHVVQHDGALGGHPGQQAALGAATQQL